MAVISMKQLLEAGVHFGHQTRRWNPKMAQYIFTERNGIYIIDLQKTVKKLEEAYMFVREIAMEGGNVLFVIPRKLQGIHSGLAGTDGGDTTEASGQNDHFQRGQIHFMQFDIGFNANFVAALSMIRISRS